MILGDNAQTQVVANMAVVMYRVETKALVNKSSIFTNDALKTE